MLAITPSPPVQQLRLDLPPLFSFTECLWYLDRGFDDCLHEIVGGELRKLIRLAPGQPPVRVSIRAAPAMATRPAQLIVETTGTPAQTPQLLAYVDNWLDLRRDLQPFYARLRADPDLAPLADAYAGLRLVGIPDVFEALCWAIIGQQINLPFAYALKRRLVARYGEQVAGFYLFPTPQQLAQADVPTLRAMQFSGRKAEYLIDLARLFAEGTLTAAGLAVQPPEQAYATLLRVRGIGEWTARYALLKAFRHPAGVPFGDAGIGQALHRLKGFALPLNRPATEAFFAQFGSWQAYLVFYLWRSLAQTAGKPTKIAAEKGSPRA